MIKKTAIEKYAPYCIWAFFIYFCFRYAKEIAAGGNQWKTGDWLINYSAGPVRRGLTGALFLNISDFGLPLLWVTYTAQVVIYTTIFILTLKLYKCKERSLFWLLILFSPAFLLFPFYDIPGGFRKEIVVFVGFAFFCLFYAQKNITQPRLIFISAIYIFAALSHELTVFTLPFFLYVIYIGSKGGLITPKIASIYGLSLTAASVAALLFSSFFKGNSAAADAICLSLMNRNLDQNICNGAIAWLGDDAQVAYNRVQEKLSYKSISTPIVFFLSILPVFFTTWWRKQALILLIVSLAAISPLFVFSIDWGRWVYILTFMVYCLVLAEDVDVKLHYKNVFLWLGLMYLTTWSIRHCCVGGIGRGLLFSPLKW